ncbi:hypothetical protein CHELA1G11_10226 [Hyphomicrobiales bacterium]|nr:hypothetical protein CHELA1G11_10226 [Hyphomicrobiales bacterium]CAH1676173.1 hypothetical protein CHELA1G2_14081 [Hyphomicrobiales bacterium]
MGHVPGLQIVVILIDGWQLIDRKVLDSTIFDATCTRRDRRAHLGASCSLFHPLLTPRSPLQMRHFDFTASANTSERTVTTATTLAWLQSNRIVLSPYYIFISANYNQPYLTQLLVFLVYFVNLLFLYDKQMYSYAVRYSEYLTTFAACTQKIWFLRRRRPFRNRVVLR